MPNLGGGRNKGKFFFFKFVEQTVLRLEITKLLGNRFDTQFFGFIGYGTFFVSLFIYWNIFDWRNNIR